MNKPLDSQLPQFELKQVSLKASVGLQYLLQDISCQIFRGDRIALVGPSGAGKTVLLRLLNRLAEPSQGQIFYDGQDLRRMASPHLRQQVALVMQEPKLLGLSVQAALEYPLRLRKLPSQTIQQRMREWLERLRIPSEWLERTEAQLSVGQRQLVAIARALITQPQVLLLDEPTSALDLGHSAPLLEIFSQLAQQQVTVVMATHQLDQAQQFCSRLLYLHNGQLLRNTPAEQIDWAALQDGLLQAELQEAQEWD